MDPAAHGMLPVLPGLSELDRGPGPVQEEGRQTGRARGWGEKTLNICQLFVPQRQQNFMQAHYKFTVLQIV